VNFAACRPHHVLLMSACIACAVPVARSSAAIPVRGSFFIVVDPVDVEPFDCIGTAQKTTGIAVRSAFLFGLLVEQHLD
jgi:hypothetical protein